MRTILFLKNIIIISLILFSASCSDPIFYVTSREEKISKNNLPKTTMVTGITWFGGYYYATVGVGLWRRPEGSTRWEQVRLPGPPPAQGVGVEGGALYVGTHDGVYQSADGVNFAKVPGHDAPAAVYQVGYNVGVDEHVFFCTSVHPLTVSHAPNFNMDFQVVPGFKGANTAGDAVAGQTGISRGPGNLAYVFDFVAGFYKDYLYAKELDTGKSYVGRYNVAAGNWISRVEVPSARQGSAVFEWNHGDIRALYATYGSGYYEVYDAGGGNLQKRSPEASVSNKDAYEVSDLGKATIIGFYAHGNDLFAATTTEGLWRNTNGTWVQE